MDNEKKLKYFATTYSQFSHNYLIALLSSRETQYQYEELQNEEVYSRFVVLSDAIIYNELKELINNNDGTVITIEYGAY